MFNKLLQYYFSTGANMFNNYQSPKQQQSGKTLGDKKFNVYIYFYIIFYSMDGWSVPPHITTPHRTNLVITCMLYPVRV